MMRSNPKRRTAMPNKVKDANAQLQEWIQKKVKPEEQARQVDGWLRAAQPFIVYWADEIGQITNLTEKTEAMNDFFKNGVAVLSAEDRAGFKDALCDALQIKSTQWGERLKTLNGHKKSKDDDDEPLYVTGGWVFEHFLGLEYDPDLDRTFFAVRYPDGHVDDRLDKIVIQDRKYVPMPPNNIIRKRVILLPSQMTELQDESELLFAIKAHNYKYFDFGADETFE